MKKLHKLFVALPVSFLPLISITSCGSIDFVKAKQYFDTNYPVMHNKLVEAWQSVEDKTLIKGLKEVASIEGAFIDNKVDNYWRSAIINLRYERYTASTWTTLFGSCGKERTQVYEPKKTELQQNSEWIGTNDNIVDKFGNQIDFYHMLASYNAWVCNKITSLKDLASWAGDIAQEAKSLKGNNPLNSSFDDADLYADVDACNIGLVFKNWSDDVKSCSLPMYSYYTNLADDKTRFNNFFNNILHLKTSQTFDQQVETLINRMHANSFLLEYMNSVGLDWYKDLSYIETATKSFVERVVEKIS